jgi:SAM-dependent methyltransferase
MEIDYKTHYNQDYFTARKTYDDGGVTRVYHGPGLVWHGFDYVVEALKHLFPQQKTVLDIGCSGGDLIRRMLIAGYDAYGVDVSEYAASQAEPSVRPRITVADFTTDPGPKLAYDTFDLVMATDLLEHIYAEDLPGTMQDIADYAYHGFGFFCIATSQTGPEYIIHKGQPVPKALEGIAVAGHVNVRSPAYWSGVFKRAGGIVRWDMMYAFQTYRETKADWKQTPGWNMSNTWLVQF